MIHVEKPINVVCFIRMQLLVVIENFTQLSFIILTGLEKVRASVNDMAFGSKHGKMMIASTGGCGGISSDHAVLNRARLVYPAP